MDSREMYNATAHLSSLMTWDDEWIHFGTGEEIKFDLLDKLIEGQYIANFLNPPNVVDHASCIEMTNRQTMTG